MITIFDSILIPKVRGCNQITFYIITDNKKLLNYYKINQIN